MNKSNVQRTIIIIGAIIFVMLGISASGFWWNVQADTSTPNWSQLDVFTDYHHIPPVPTLDINHVSGQVGSYFTVTGSDYPALNTAVIYFNGHLMNTVAVDATGNFSFEFSTNNADNGFYIINIVSAGAQFDVSEVGGGGGSPSAQTHFTLDSSSPYVWPQQGTVLFDVQSGIAVVTNFLPIIKR